jgi:dienelactone hydrolase
MLHPAGFVLGLFSILLAACVGLGDPPVPGDSGAAAVAGPQGSEDAATRSQLWLIPSPQSGLLMRATLFRPPGDGPFPLAVINHGSDQIALDRDRMPMPDFPALTRWLLARGYAVLLPQRPGHGETGGRYLEDQGPCANARYVESGLATADSIAAAIDFMTGQPFIKPGGVLVIGNSAGAWGALALASRNPRNVAAVVNFAGGRGGRNRGRADNNCSPERLIAAAGTYGRTALVPTLWLYAENDSFFPPDISGEMAEVFNRSGGDVDYVLLPPVPGDGHGLINTRPPSAPWVAPLQRFLAGLS